jgi:hypothetical protein
MPRILRVHYHGRLAIRYTVTYVSASYPNPIFHSDTYGFAVSNGYKNGHGDTSTPNPNVNVHGLSYLYRVTYVYADPDENPNAHRDKNADAA